jgi:RNA recognition motif-containing protein
LRNLADDVTPDEFLVYFQQFGIATRLHIKQKGKAFVQLVNEAQAMSCMQYYVRTHQEDNHARTRAATRLISLPPWYVQ